MVERRRWSRCTHDEISGGRNREVEGQVIRCVPSLGVVLSHGQGVGGLFPMLSPGDQPLFALRRNRTEDSSLVQPLWCLAFRRGGRVYSC